MIASDSISTKYATSIDVYSFAIVMWELLFEDNPYLYKNTEKLFFKIDFEKTAYKKLTNFNVLAAVVRGMRPVVPFTNPEMCQQWCEIYLMPNEETSCDLQRYSQCFFSLVMLIRESWNSDPKLRPSFETITKRLIQLRDSIQ